MKVRPLLSKVNTKTFIKDLLTAYGVGDINGYLHPSLDMMDNPWDYPNMDKAVKLFHRFVKSEKSEIGVLVD